MSNIYVLEPATSGKVCLHTTVGDIDIELWAKECPLACRNFVQLCMEGYYNGCVFHRVVKDFIVQGGDPTGTGQGGESIYSKPFKDEFHQRLKFCRRGLVGMANAGRNDNGSQFFFTLGPTPDLDKKHTLFAKVVGDTLFNMLRLGEGEVDRNERPLIIHKITGATVLNNPFSDIVLRKVEKKEVPKEKRKEKKEIKKNLALLSFGDEAEEDEEELAIANSRLKSKSKSAHDILSDTVLSKDPAVHPEELLRSSRSDNVDEEDEESVTRISRIREKLMRRKRKANEEDNGARCEEEDLEKIINEEAEEKRRKELEELSAELRTMQKNYRKALKKPKEQIEDEEEEEPRTEAMQMYRKMKLKFKESSKGIVKQKDPSREEQTLKLLERFQKKLANSNREAILFDRKVDIPKNKAADGDGEKAEIPLGKLDLDAEDIKGDEWLGHRFVAPEEQREVSRAKDANLREISEDWYDITDPRNKINQRRRGEQ